MPVSYLYYWHYCPVVLKICSKILGNSWQWLGLIFLWTDLKLLRIFAQTGPGLKPPPIPAFQELNCSTQNAQLYLLSKARVVKTWTMIWFENVTPLSFLWNAHILLMSQRYIWRKIWKSCFVGRERERGDQTLFRLRPQTLNMNELLHQSRKTFDANFIQKSNSIQSEFCVT